MPGQAFIFDPYHEELVPEAPIVRTADPPTSHEAAAVINRQHVRSVVRQAAAALLATRADATAREVAEEAHRMDPGHELESYRKRVPEMTRDGIFTAGTPRQCLVTGKKAAVITACT